MPEAQLAAGGRQVTPNSPNGAPMGLQWWEMGENNLSDFVVFSVCFIVFSWFYGALISPKWLSKVRGLIPILFG